MQIRLNHENCNSKMIATKLDKISKVKQFLRKNMQTDRNVIENAIQAQNASMTSESKFKWQSSACRGLYNPSAFKKLELICTDCYNLFKESEVYTYCMAGCFETPFFLTCVRSLMMEEDMVMELVKMVGK